jgi:hypothetical protein
MNNMKKYMNRYLRLFPVFLFACSFFACNNNEVFEKEQYKNVFAIVSGTDNVVTWVHDLRAPESQGYVAASLGGTNPSTKDINVTLVEDVSLIDNYNNVIYDVNTMKYIQPLPSSKYTIDNLSLTIPAGEVTASIPVKIRPAGLSPDSAYFIALKVDSYSAYEVNPDKDFILYRVQIKNWWSVTGGTVYNQRGNIIAAGSTGNPVQVFGTKRLFPMTPTKVRLLAGTELNDASTAHVYDWYSMEMEIGNDNNITLKPYKDVVMTQINGDPDFPNKVFLEDDGFKTYKTFLLYYSYKSSGGTIYNIKEELRLEYKEDPEDPRFL